MLTRECQVFVRYLCRANSTAYVEDKYTAAHRDFRGFSSYTRADRWMLAVARQSPAATRVADAFSRVFVPRGALRQKLTCLLAILETSPGFRSLAAGIDPATPTFIVGVRLLMLGAIGLLAVLCGAVIFGPLIVLARLTDRFA